MLILLIMPFVFIMYPLYMNGKTTNAASQFHGKELMPVRHNSNPKIEIKNTKPYCIIISGIFNIG